MKLRVWALVVNYQSADHTSRCLDSLKAERESTPEVDLNCLVIDNSSSDNSVVQLKEWIQKSGTPNWITLVPQPLNRGFGAGNNAGFKFVNELGPESKADFFLLLNPDTILGLGSLRALVDFARKTPKAVATGPLLLDSDGSPHPSAFYFPSFLRELAAALSVRRLEEFGDTFRCFYTPENRHPRRVDWISGAVMLVRSEEIRAAGFFDESFFLYFEDCDLCRRLKSLGGEIWQDPRIVMTHHRGGSSSTISVPKEWLLSRRRYLERHHGSIYRAACDAIWLAGFLFRRFAESLGLARRKSYPPNYLKMFITQALGQSRGQS